MTYHDLGYFAPFAEKTYSLDDIPENFTLKDFLKKNPKKPFCYPYVIFKFLKLKKLRQQLQKVDYHTTPSEFMKEIVIKHNFASKDKIQVLPNFILKEKIVPRIDKFQDKINFIFFGRLEFIFMKYFLLYQVLQEFWFFYG